MWYMGYCHPTIIGNSCKVGILLYPCLWIFMRDCHPFDVNIINVLTWSQRWRKQQTSAFQAQLFETYGGFHKWGYPKMDGLNDIMENLIKLDDLGVPLFQESLILRLVHSLKLWPPCNMGSHSEPGKDECVSKVHLRATLWQMWLAGKIIELNRGFSVVMFDYRRVVSAPLKETTC